MSWESEQYDAWCQTRDDQHREFGITNGWLFEYVDHCTCVADSLPGSVTNGHHEKGCGQDPIGPVLDLIRPCPRDHMPEVPAHVPRDEPPF